MGDTPKRFALYFLVVVLSLLLYVPFRLLGERYQQVLYAGTNNFYYIRAIVIWPLFTFLVAAVPAYSGARSKIPVYVRLPVYFLILASWDYLPGLDQSLPVEGTSYLSAYETMQPGEFNTTYLSFLLQPVSFFVGIGFGEVLGRLHRGRGLWEPAGKKAGA